MINAAATRRFFSRPAALAMLAGLTLAGCSTGSPPALPNDICTLALPFIGQLQGVDDQSPLTGQQATVRAVVTAVMPGQGFFIHDPVGDSHPGTSEGLWVADPEPPFPGELWVWRGTVAELPAAAGTLTSLTEISGRKKCANHVTLPVSDLSLPNSQREGLESMRVRLAAGLQVVQPPNRHRPHTISVATERVFAPTEMVRPGPAVAAMARRFAAATMDLSLPPGRHAYRAGDTLEAVVGVYDLREQPRLISDAAPRVASANGIPAAPLVRGEIRIVSMNLLNYFNGDGRGGDFPTPRGAASAQQFANQRAQILAAAAELEPNVLAVQELENDGYGEHSAIADLRRGLMEATGGAHWHYITPPAEQLNDGRLGNDAITVGLLYRADRVQPKGAALTVSDGEFGDRHRPVLAQRFALGEKQRELLLAVVHLKSKGSCPPDGPDANQYDGQACWNASRTAASQFLSAWLKAHTAAGGAIVLGDFNSYRMEDPIRTLRRAGLVELVGQFAMPPLYSYIYRGGRGTLDYAFATPDTLSWVGQALHWHVNADASDPPGSDGALWRRFSDHDPLIVDLRAPLR